ncbi:MAG: hypothetical protein HYY28_15505 [Betaproteobacteria bacterium]|nr:hypothetical protein [Betaproteobacteria bacterium]
MSTTKFGFRIRTRQGLVVANLMIHGRDEADAERKLRQMYQHCEIIGRKIVRAAKSAEAQNLAQVVPIVRRLRSASN